LAKICDSGSCREFEAVIFGGITSPWGVHHLPKVSSQSSKWFGRSIDRKFGVDPRAFFFWDVQEVPTLRLYVPVGVRKLRQYLLLSLGLGPEVLTSWSYVPVGCYSSRFCQKFRQYLPVGLGLGPEVLTSWLYIPVGCCNARFCSALSVVVSISLPLCFLAFQALFLRSQERFVCDSA
jgi:hypothetical protein